MSKAQMIEHDEGRALTTAPEAASALAPTTEAAAIIAMIERAATNPAVDIDKMERLMRMHGDMVSRVAEQAFNTAMRAAQERMKRVAADKENSQTRSSYASHAALDRMVRPIYTENGFALSYDSGEGAPADCVRVVCFVSHSDGFTRKYHVDMPADGKGAKGGDVMTKTHAAGSAFTYGQRYLLKLIFNIAIGEDADDDGNAAGAGDCITDEQVQELNQLLMESKSNLALFLKRIKLESLTQIRADKFQDAMNLIKENAKKRAAMAQQGAQS